MFRKIERAALPFTILGWVAFFCVFNFVSKPRAEQQVGPPNAILCNASATFAVGFTSISSIVSAVSGQRVFLCGWHVTNTGSSGNFTISYGTGTNCGTGTQTWIPALNVTSSAPSADHIDYATIATPQSQAVCITASVNTISGGIWYAQF